MNFLSACKTSHTLRYRELGNPSRCYDREKHATFKSGTEVSEIE